MEPISQYQLAELQNEEAAIAMLAEQIKATRTAVRVFEHRLRKHETKRERLYAGLSRAMQNGASVEHGPLKAFLEHKGQRRKLVVK